MFTMHRGIRPLWFNYEKNNKKGSKLSLTVQILSFLSHLHLKNDPSLKLISRKLKVRHAKEELTPMQISRYNFYNNEI